eukprot:14602433-Alexandrium_andersonii.AAC.1
MFGIRQDTEMGTCQRPHPRCRAHRRGLDRLLPQIAGQRRQGRQAAPFGAVLPCLVAGPGARWS